LLFLLGCDGKSASSQTGSVSGQVTFASAGGKPLVKDMVRMELHPPGGGQEPASGTVPAFTIMIQPDGTFTSTVPAGEYAVVFDIGPTNQTAPGTGMSREEMVRMMKANLPKLREDYRAAGVELPEIPAAYSSPKTTPINWKIEGGTNPPKDFQVPAGP
jgi:hypothetical protein